MNEEEIRTKLGKEYRKRTIKGEETEVDSLNDDEKLDSQSGSPIITDKDLAENKDSFSQE